jgi:aminoglycoside phosphotransferase (APT) family kinase protein
MDAIQQRLLRDEAYGAFAEGLASGDARTREWFEATVGALLDYSETSDLAPPAIVARPSAGGGADAAAVDESARLRACLNQYLQRRFPKLPPEPITQFRIAPGGHAKQTAIFSVLANDSLPSYLVLRRDLALSITGTRVSDEFPVLERVFKLGLPIPRPILVEPDAAVLGGSFMIMEEVRDVVISGTYFPEERRHAPKMTGAAFGPEVARLLASLHSGTRTAGHATRQQQLVRESYESWKAIQNKPPASLSVDLGFAWVLSHPLPADRPRCLIHGDVGCHNILTRDGHLVAMLDWELAQDGDPAEDIAQCRMMLLPDHMSWDDFVREYVAAGGDPYACDSKWVAWFCIWTYLKHALMNAKLRANYLAGARDDVVAASVSGHYTQRLMQYQARSLQIAVEASRSS